MPKLGHFRTGFRIFFPKMTLNKKTLAQNERFLYFPENRFHGVRYLQRQPVKVGVKFVFIDFGLRNSEIVILSIYELLRI